MGARRLQRSLITAALQQWPQSQHVRYDTGNGNLASLAIAKSCGMAATAACHFGLLHLADLPDVIGRIRQRTPPAGVLDVAEAPRESLEASALYPCSPGAVVLGSWKIVDVRCQVFAPGAVRRRKGVGVIARDDSLPGTRALNCFLERANDSTGTDYEAFLAMIGSELQAALDDKTKSVHVFTPLEFEAFWREFLSMHAGGVIPEMLMMVDAERADVLKALTVDATSSMLNPQEA